MFFEEGGVVFDKISEFISNGQDEIERSIISVVKLQDILVRVELLE